MKTWGLGVRGWRSSRIPTWRGSALPLRRLQGAQEATMFSQLDGPPFERGTTWSTVRFARDPQYWHVQLSRANTARRVILRRCVSRGMRTYVTRRITIGRDMVVVAEWSSHSACSITSAFSLSSSTTARRTVQTLIGSNVALRTSTRPTVGPRRWCSSRDADRAGTGVTAVAMAGASVARGAPATARTEPAFGTL